MMNPVLLTEDNKRDQGYYPNRLVRVLIYIYIIISFYEAYLNKIIGYYTRYYIFALIIVVLFSYKKTRITSVHWLMIFWLCFKLFSILWGQGSPYQSGDVSTHLYAHLGMVGLFIAMTLVSYNEKFIKNMVNLSMYTSFSMAVLGLFFSQAYIDERLKARQVLTIFGAQNDPNNLAAFYLVGFGIALLYLMSTKTERLKFILITIITGYSIIMTGSRAGFLSMIIILLSIIVFDKSKKSFTKGFKKLFTAIIVVSVFYLIIINFLPIDVMNRIIGFDAYSSGSGRDYLWETGILFIREKPLFGWGWGGNPVQGSHNTIITMILEVGIIGTLSFMFPIILVFKSSSDKKNSLPIVVLLSGLLPSLFIDAINKRFLWNGIILALMIINSIKINYKSINDKHT